ncbi:MAG: hypothetical protein HY670_11890 [Chloroflexi bacterium]|nr:hypothetical protein [Chloroflexota bacterium]
MTKKEDILADCIADIQSGKRTLEECLSAYPHLRDELKSLLEIATSIQPEKSPPTPEFKQRARRRLLEAMAEDKVTPAPWRVVLDWLRMPVPRGVFSLAVAITILFLTAASGTAVYAYQYSLPGEALYPVKTGVEKIQLTVTFEPEERFKLRSRLAQRRIDEVVAQSNAGRPVSTAVGQSVATQLDGAIKEISKVSSETAQPLLGQLVQTTLRQQIAIGQMLEKTPEGDQTALDQALDVTRRGTLIAQVAHGNNAFLATAPSVLDEALETAQLRLEGTLESVEGGSWTVGGLLVKNVNASSVAPPSGSNVKIEAVVKNDTVFVSKVEPKEKETENVRIQGSFEGTSSDGSAWIVNKIPVTKPDNTTATPAPGSQLGMEGNTKSNTFTVMETPAETDKNEVKISGSLVEVDHPKESISVSVAGTNMQINVSQAPIKSKDGQTMTLAELQPLTEKREDVQAKGLYLKEGKIYAKEVRVAVEKGKSDKDERDKDKDDDDKKAQKVEKTDKDNKDQGKTETGKKSNNKDNKDDDD